MTGWDIIVSLGEKIEYSVVKGFCDVQTISSSIIK